MARKKKVRVDYFTVIDYVKNKDKEGNESVIKKLFDLDDAFTRLSEIETVNRTFFNKSKDYKIRVQILNKKFHNKLKNKLGNPYEYWEIEILKERNSSLPGIATKEGEFNSIDVEDGDMISEDISLLYDPEKCIMAVFRKKEGLSPSGIAEFLTNIIEGSNVTLNTIIMQSDLERFTSEKIYTSLDISLISESVDDEKSLLGVVSDGKSLGAPVIKVHYGLGRSKNKLSSLNFQSIFNVINNYVCNIGTKKLSVKMKENEKSKVETYDLINCNLHSTGYLDIDKVNPLTHTRIFDFIETEYFKKIENDEFDNIVI